jgi:peptide deformylase
MKLTKRVLHKKAKPVDFRYPQQNLQLQEQMHKFMVRENGIGLAAPQIGISRRIFVMQFQGQQWHCFNPEIIDTASEMIDFDEGCLSFPGEHCIIKRPRWVDVSYQDHRGHRHSERLDSILARCFQHELDHLDGITMWDRHKEQHAEQS